MRRNQFSHFFAEGLFDAVELRKQALLQRSRAAAWRVERGNRPQYAANFFFGRASAHNQIRERAGETAVLVQITDKDACESPLALVEPRRAKLCAEMRLQRLRAS